MQRRNVVLMATVGLMVLATGCARGAVPSAQPVAPAATERPAATATVPAGPAPTATIDYANQLEDFDPGNFDNPTTIDNRWFPLEPGTQWVYEGSTEESGASIPHRVIFTVTDLTKVIDGVRTVVVWDQDFSEGTLEETELAFFAQDNFGNVWHLGQYPEVYEHGKFVEAPAWISGIKHARAGISMKAEPKEGTPSYSQGWGPAVNWTDRAQVSQMGRQTCVSLGCYEDVLVIQEFNREEPDAFQLKSYAPGVGNVQVGWRGADATRETLELVERFELSPEEMEAVRQEALELEQRAYEVSQEVYAQTSPAELPVAGSE